MPERFDLLRVRYMGDRDPSASRLCFAPYCKVSEGDIVETAYGKAFVEEMVSFCSKDDPMIKMLLRFMTIDRVLAKVVPLKYEEAE